MRKRVTPALSPVPIGSAPPWLSLENVSEVEITSEDPEHPIEGALVPDFKNFGWRAAVGGPQSLRLYFDSPPAYKMYPTGFSRK